MNKWLSGGYLGRLHVLVTLLKEDKETGRYDEFWLNAYKTLRTMQKKAHVEGKADDEQEFYYRASAIGEYILGFSGGSDGSTD